MAVNVTIKIKTNNLFFFSFFFNEKNVLRRWQFVIVIFRYSFHFPFHFMKEIRFLKCNKIIKCFVHSYKSQTNHCEGKAPIDKNVSISRHRYALCYIQTFPLTKKKHNIVPNNNASVMVVSLHSSALSEKSYMSCDKPLLQTVITSPLLICFCQAIIFSIVNSFPVVILGTNLLEIKFFLFQKIIKKEF